MYNHEFSKYIARLESYQAFENILKHPTVKLSDFQSADLLRALYEKIAVITYDTGLGKTVLSAAIMKALSNINPSSRFLFFGKRLQIPQTPDDLENLTGFKSLSVTAAANDVFDKVWGQRLEQYKIVFLTFQTLNNPYVMRYLYEYRWAFNGVFVDEAHEISNFLDSSSALMLRAVLRQFEYRYALTATPITSAPEQLANLIHMMNPETYPSIKTMRSDVQQGHNITIRRPGMFINRNRSDLGFDTIVDPNLTFLDPMPHQLGVGGKQVTMTTKGPGAVVQAEWLANTLDSRRKEGMKGLVYINYHEVREWVLPFLDKLGIRYECINGYVKDAAREQIKQDFKDGKLDVIITSVTTSLNLECDYVSFYEYSADIKQMIGRAHRGLNPKNLILDFIFTRGTGELEHFIEFVYKRSLLIQHLIGKDYKELIDAGEKVSMQL